MKIVPTDGTRAANWKSRRLRHVAVFWAALSRANLRDHNWTPSCFRSCVQCLNRVNHVGPTRPTTSRYVRCTSDSTRICALRRFDEECQEETSGFPPNEMRIKHPLHICELP